jgi:hypothetical protein
VTYAQVRPYRVGGGSLPRLVRQGQFFVTEDGQPWTAIESSEFSAYKRFLDGEDLTPVALERQALGFNLWRVWLLNQSVVGRRHSPGGAQILDAGIHPDQYPDFYTRLPAFASFAAQYGAYVEFTVFTSTGTLMPREEDQQAHLTETQQALADVPCFIELVNEADQYDNTPKPGLTAVQYLNGPQWISRGSNGADSPPPRHDSPWDYECYHTNGLNEFQRKVGHNAWEWAAQSGHPCISNENTRYPDQDSSTNHAFDAAMGGAFFCMGSCYHSGAGKFGVLFDATEFACANAWVQGARSVPLEFRLGAYTHRTDLEGPNCIRAYEKRLPDWRSYIIKIRP